MTARDHMKDMKDIRPRQAFRERTSQEIMFKLRLDTKSANWCVCVCVWCVHAHSIRRIGDLRMECLWEARRAGDSDAPHQYKL